MTAEEAKDLTNKAIIKNIRLQIASAVNIGKFKTEIWNFPPYFKSKLEQEGYTVESFDQIGVRISW